MPKVLSFVLAISLFINIGLFAKWREVRRIPKLINFDDSGGAERFDLNLYDLKLVEPVAVTQSIGYLQMQWWNNAVAKCALKSIVDKDFPEESPILFIGDEE